MPLHPDCPMCKCESESQLSNVFFNDLSESQKDKIKNHFLGRSMSDEYFMMVIKSSGLENELPNMIKEVIL